MTMRKSITHLSCLVIAALPFLTLDVAAARSPRFMVRDLGTLAGAETMVAVKINNHGQVLGNALDANGNPQPFLYRRGVLTPLNVGEHGGYGYNLNDRGDVVGLGMLTRGHYFFLYQNGSVTDL